MKWKARKALTPRSKNVATACEQRIRQVDVFVCTGRAGKCPTSGNKAAREMSCR